MPFSNSLLEFLDTFYNEFAFVIAKSDSRHKIDFNMFGYSLVEFFLPPE
jgi:hypothetical protein